VTVAPPRLCHPFPGREAYARTLHQALGRLDGFDPSRHVLGPLETCRFPRHAVRMRHSVLLRVYCGDYHTDCFDIDRLAHAVERGEERIWLWGEEDQIRAFHAYCTGDFNDPPDLRLGTVTVLPAEFLFGAGRHELCRSGSCDTSLGAKGASLQRIVNFVERHAEAGPADSWVLTPRNRASAPSLRGGEAVHRLHSHHLRTRFWGFAPWYVMQGGALEMLDLRECDRDGGDTDGGRHWRQPWLLRTPQAARFVAALTWLNYRRVPPIEVVADARADGFLTARTGRAYDASIQPFNPTAMVVGTEGDLSLDDAHRTLEARNACAMVARVALTESDAPAAQAFLEDRGYRLTGILPPTPRVPPQGFWTWIHPHHPVAPPHYLNSCSDDEENAVLDYCRTRLLDTTL